MSAPTGPSEIQGKEYQHVNPPYLLTTDPYNFATAAALNGSYRSIPMRFILTTRGALPRGTAPSCSLESDAAYYAGASAAHLVKPSIQTRSL
jgi:hypothetical protein